MRYLLSKIRWRTSEEDIEVKLLPRTHMYTDVYTYMYTNHTHTSHLLLKDISARWRLLRWLFFPFNTLEWSVVFNFYDKNLASVFLGDLQGVCVCVSSSYLYFPLVLGNLTRTSFDFYRIHLCLISSISLTFTIPVGKFGLFFKYFFFLSFSLISSLGEISNDVVRGPF